MGTSIKISTMKAAATDLKAKAKRLDTDHSGALSKAELRTGRASAGDVAVHAINKFHSSMYGNRWYGSTDANGDLKLSALKTAVDLSINQLNAIDAYKGNASTGRPGNTKDGKVTPTEIKHYSHGNGTLPHMAQQIVWYAKNK
jgi:hypothetical protein